MKRPARICAAAAALALVAAVGGATEAQFTASTSNGSLSFDANPDWMPPAVSQTIIGKTTGGSGGYLRQGGTYYVYANVADQGNPPAGIASVTTNTSSIDTGVTAAALTTTGGPYTVEGVSYAYRSASLTANAAITAGTYGYSIFSQDSDSPANSQTQSGYNVVVDNTAPSASDVQTANGGATVARPELGDTVTFTYSEPIDPSSIVSGWTGTAATNVTVRIVHNGSGTNDTVLIRNDADTANLAITNATGVNLNQNSYVSATASFGAPAAAQRSTMTLVGGPPSAVVRVTLGTLGTGTVGTETSNSTMSWTPLGSPITDRAGNNVTTTARSEQGAADREF